jgi:hypothetical protein
MESKYARFIVTKPGPERPGQKNGPDIRASMAFLDGNVIPGAFYCETHWYKKPTFPTPKHTHDFDEVLGFFGGDPLDPLNLNGEVELWIEDEKHIIHESCLVFIPAGVSHCPMKVSRADKPIFHFSTGNSKGYERE